MNRRGTKRHFGILFIGLFCLCVHPTITMREHLYDQIFPGQNYNFYRLFTFISGTVLYRSYFGGIFCCRGKRS